MNNTQYAVTGFIAHILNFAEVYGGSSYNSATYQDRNANTDNSSDASMQTNAIPAATGVVSSSEKATTTSAGTASSFSGAQNPASLTAPTTQTDRHLSGGTLSNPNSYINNIPAPALLGSGITFVIVGCWLIQRVLIARKLK